MRLVYIDESGTDAASNVCVVVGVYVEPDSQSDMIEGALDAIREALSPELPSDWILHATEIYSGGKTLPRERFSKEHRFRVLNLLLGLFQQLGLALAVTYVWQNKDRHSSSHPEHVVRHLVTFGVLVPVINHYLKWAFPGEKASLIAEDVPEMRGMLIDFPEFLRKQTRSAVPPPMPFDSVVDGVHFTAARFAPALQLADAAAFAIRRALAGLKDGKELAIALLGADAYDKLLRDAATENPAGGSFFWQIDSSPSKNSAV